MSMDFMIGQNRLLKERKLCVAFDLSIRSDVLSQIVSTVMSPGFRNQFSGFRFAISFLGQVPIFVTMQRGVINLAFGAVFDDGCELFFGVDELGSLLEDVFSMVNAMVLPGTAEASFRALFEVMSKQALLGMYLFHFVEIPKCEDDLPFTVNLIEVKPVASESKSIFQALQNGWTHLAIEQCDGELTGYMYNLMSRVCSSSVKLIVKLSSGLEFAWACGSKQDKTVQGDRLETTLNSYASNSTVTVAVQPSSKFHSASFFSIQTIHQYDKEFALVSNRCWKKAASISEWAESFNVVYLCSVILKQMSAVALSSLTRKSKFRLFSSFSSSKYIWDISSLQIEASTITFARKACNLFKALIISESSPIPAEIRKQLMFLTMTQGHFYLGYITGCLMMVNPDHEILHLPPFILVPSDSVESSVSKDTNFHIVSSKFVFPRDQFEKLRHLIVETIK